MADETWTSCVCIKHGSVEKKTHILRYGSSLRVPPTANDGPDGGFGRLDPRHSLLVGSSEFGRVFCVQAGYVSCAIRREGAIIVNDDMERSIRAGAVTGLCWGLLALSAWTSSAQAAGMVLPLAQAAPAPASVPANVRKVGRMYVAESIVLIVLFGGALYAVCRTSRRT